MKVAIIGSRKLFVKDFQEYIPKETTEIVSGGAKGIDTCAAMYAKEKGLKLTEFLPNYDLFGRGAPLKRNDQIIDYADVVIAFWDGESRGTSYVIKQCEQKGKKCEIYIIKQ